MEKERLELLKSLVNEISKGMEQVKEVKMCCSNSEQDGVLERMLSSHEEALSILTGRDPQGQCQSVISSSSNPPGSSTSVSKVAHSKYLRERKTRTDSWKVKMKTSKGASLDDGYCWRKYGQKDILGAKYPRSYYKCITRGCPARRTLQRLDDDPTTIDVTYNNIKHTCQAGSKPESHTEESQESIHAKMEP